MAEQFIDKRIKVTLHDATLLRRGEERRHHFRMSINLSEDGILVGLPEWMQNSFTLAQKAANRADGIKSKTILETMSLGFWSTEKTRTKFFSQVIGATLSKFVFQREGQGDDADVRLYFSAYFPGRKEIHEWTYDHKAADMWMDFEQQQGDLGMAVVDPNDAEAAKQERKNAKAAAKGPTLM